MPAQLQNPSSCNEMHTDPYFGKLREVLDRSPQFEVVLQF
jgi:hypothetical protein